MARKPRDVVACNFSLSRSGSSNSSEAYGLILRRCAPPQSRPDRLTTRLAQQVPQRDVDAAYYMFQRAAAALPERGLPQSFGRGVGIECRRAAPEVFELGDAGGDQCRTGEDTAEADGAVFGDDFEDGVQIVVRLMGPRPTAVDGAAKEAVGANFGDVHMRILLQGTRRFTTEPRRARRRGTGGLGSCCVSTSKVGKPVGVRVRLRYWPPGADRTTHPTNSHPSLPSVSSVLSVANLLWTRACAGPPGRVLAGGLIGCRWIFGGGAGLRQVNVLAVWRVAIYWSKQAKNRGLPMSDNQKPLVRRKDLDSIDNLCDHCTAMCCRYFALPLDEPEDFGELEYLRWYLLHDRATVFTEDDTWYLLVHTECKHIQEDYRCGIYLTRPLICREYTTKDCEYDNDAVYDKYFEDARAGVRLCRGVVSTALSRRHPQPQAGDVAVGDRLMSKAEGKEKPHSQLIQPRTLKGFRDFVPEAMIPREQLIETARRVYRSYGYSPIDTPALEYHEILAGKGGAESDKQLYHFEDHGKRQVAMRFDLTVPLARFAAQHIGQLGTPLKRYHIATVWRGENTQRGRYREFMQCDFDTIGTESIAADVETALVIHDLLRTIGFERFTISINNRKVLNGLLERLGLADSAVAVLRALDKLAKIGREKVAAEMQAGGITAAQADEVLKLAQLTGTSDEVLAALEPLIAVSETGAEGVAQLRDVLAGAQAGGVPSERLR